MTTTAITDLDRERALFEAEMKSLASRTEFERRADGEYVDPITEAHWETWQARAALPQQVVATLKSVDLDVIARSYDWTIDQHGEVLGVTAGDMGYENTGIKFTGDTLDIWNDGVSKIGRAQQVVAAGSIDRPEFRELVKPEVIGLVRFKQAVSYIDARQPAPVSALADELAAARKRIAELDECSNLAIEQMNAHCSDAERAENALRRLRDGMDSLGWCAEFGELAMEVLREPSAPAGAGAADKPSARENFANILRIQRAEAETGDPYMIGLYNGMSMMCANFDNTTDWDMLPARAADIAPWPDYVGNSIRQGDVIRHPEGTEAKVVFDAEREGVSAWRAVYKDGESLWLGNQIGNKGMAVVVNPAAQQQAATVPDDPMDWPLPCDVKVGHGTIGKGCKLRTLVLRMQALYDMAQESLPKVTPEMRAQFDALFNRGAAATTDGRDGE